jgi:TRAP-type mannitol/chloroaromatic compound transport system permease large subunit
MKFNTKALALTSGILWGLAMLVMGLANLIWGNYGQHFLQTMSSVYPGYHATRSVAEVVVGTLYGAADGLIGGAGLCLALQSVCQARRLSNQEP